MTLVMSLESSPSRERPGKSSAAFTISSKQSLAYCVSLLTSWCNIMVSSLEKRESSMIWHCPLLFFRFKCDLHAKVKAHTTKTSFSDSTLIRLVSCITGVASCKHTHTVNTQTIKKVTKSKLVRASKSKPDAWLGINWAVFSWAFLLLFYWESRW